MPEYVPIDSFLSLSSEITIVDVRAPVEFLRAHIPGATNIPLFNDEQRAAVGTTYRNDGRLQSVLLGLEFVGPRMRSLTEQLLAAAVKDKLLIHCWRGGMRSRSISWLAEQIGIETLVLQGGYKAYRRHVLQSFKQPLRLFVLSGLTGAGKTRQIELLERRGEQVIDLEGLAKHRGSAFGGIGQERQPTTEHFENVLFEKIKSLDIDKRIWVEDESRNVGAIKLPHHFFDQLRSAPAIFMDVDQATRNQLIRDDYGSAALEDLMAAICRLEKRLGGQNVQTAIHFLKQSQMNSAVDLLLGYYDRLYLANKDRIQRKFYVDMKVTHPESESTTRRLIERANTFNC